MQAATRKARTERLQENLKMVFGTRGAPHRQVSRRTVSTPQKTSCVPASAHLRHGPGTQLVSSSPSLHNLQQNLRRCCHVPYFLLKYLSSNNFFVYLRCVDVSWGDSCDVARTNLLSMPPLNCAARLSAGFLFDIESIYSNKITDIRSNVVMCHIFCLIVWFVINYLYICGVFTTIRVSFPRGVRLTLRLRKEDFLSSFFFLMRLLNRHVPAYADNSRPPHNLQVNALCMDKKIWGSHNQCESLNI